MTEYLGVLLILVFAVALLAVLIRVQTRIAPRREFAEKLEPFACGEGQLRPPRRRVAVKFHQAAILFVVVDAAAVYLYPWAVAFERLGSFGLIGLGLFALPLVVGLVYEWKKGALEW